MPGPFFITGEAMPGSMAANMATSIPLAITNFLTSSSTSSANLAVGTAQRTADTATTGALAATEAGRDAASDAIEAGRDAASDAIEAGRDVAAVNIGIGGRIRNSVQSLVQHISTTLKSIMQKITHKLFSVWTISFILIVLTLFGFLKKVFLWAIDTMKCVIIRLQNFNGCFFWYTLEIIGQILYLPIRFIVWLGGGSLKSVESSIWNAIHEMDCAFYGATSVHVIHYPESILKKCYNCKFKPFPNIIAHWEEVGKQKSPESVFRSIVGF
jgi:hypothetical protein